MNIIAQNRRKYRELTGSLFFDNKKIRFDLDEKSLPIGYKLDNVIYKIEIFIFIKRIIKKNTLLNNFIINFIKNIYSVF